MSYFSVPGGHVPTHYAGDYPYGWPGVNPYVSPCQPSMPSPLPWTSPPSAPITSPAEVAGWTVVGHCPKCGMPVYARPQPFNPTSSCMVPSGIPETRRSCSCKTD